MFRNKKAHLLIYQAVQLVMHRLIVVRPHVYDGVESKPLWIRVRYWCGIRSRYSDVCTVVTFLIHHIMCVVCMVHCAVVRYNDIAEGKSLVLSASVSQMVKSDLPSQVKLLFRRLYTRMYWSCIQFHAITFV